MPVKETIETAISKLPLLTYAKLPEKSAVTMVIRVKINTSPHTGLECFLLHPFDSTPSVSSPRHPSEHCPFLYDRRRSVLERPA